MHGKHVALSPFPLDQTLFSLINPQKDSDCLVIADLILWCEVHYVYVQNIRYDNDKTIIHNYIQTFSEPSGLQNPSSWQNVWDAEASK